MKDTLDFTRELGMSISKIQNKEQKRLMLGAVVKLTEIAKGNLESLNGQSLESILDNQLSLFTSYSQTGTNNKENVSDLRRGALPD